MKFFATLLITSILFNFIFEVSAQTIIKGRVVDKRDKFPLPGVTVLEMGTFNGAVTDIEGNFALTLSDPESQIMFKFVGFETVIYEKLIPGTFHEIRLKVDCIKCWFDGREIDLGLSSGILETPFGGNFGVSHRIKKQVTIKLQTNYQTDLKRTHFWQTQLELAHLIVNCTYDADFRVNHTRIEKSFGFNFESYLAETVINIDIFSSLYFFGINRLNFGIGKSRFRFSKDSSLRESYGYAIGLGGYVHDFKGISYINGKVAYWNSFWEFQGEVSKSFKRVSYSIRYTKIDHFEEVSLKLSYRFHY